MGTESGERDEEERLAFWRSNGGIRRDNLSCTVKEGPAHDDSSEDESYVSPNFPRPRHATLARGQFVSHAVPG